MQSQPPEKSFPDLCTHINKTRASESLISSECPDTLQKSNPRCSSSHSAGVKESGLHCLDGYAVTRHSLSFPIEKSFHLSHSTPDSNRRSLLAFIEPLRAHWIWRGVQHLRSSRATTLATRGRDESLQQHSQRYPRRQHYQNNPQSTPNSGLDCLYQTSVLQPRFLCDSECFIKFHQQKTPHSWVTCVYIPKWHNTPIHPLKTGSRILKFKKKKPPTNLGVSNSTNC